MQRCISTVFLLCWGLVLPRVLSSQEGTRVFCPTDDVVGIWEFNDLPVEILEPVPNGTVVPDLSGNGLDAVVVDNGAGDLIAQEGDPNYDQNTGIERVGGGGAARVTVEDDGGAFEMDEEQDFTFEMYVTRAEAVGGATWGVLGGTLHTRDVLNDAEDPNSTGAWYGWGIFQRGGQPGWLLVVSPTAPDGTVGPQGCCPNERRNDASWEITPGSHYIAASFDRALHVASVYLDGELVETLNLQPTWAFLNPAGYPPANLTFLTGVDDLSRRAFRPPPTGYSIDAARVTKRAMDADEILDNWFNIQDSLGAPPCDELECQALISVSARNLLVGQCAELSGATSIAGEGNTVTKYEWKVGDGDFEEGQATREISFDAATGDAGVDVTLRISTSAGGSCQATVTLVASDPPPVADIEARLGNTVLNKGRFLVPLGQSVTLDGTNSSTPIPDTALVCPLANGDPVPEPAITEYRWDLDSDGNADDTRPSFDTDPLTTAGNFTITLTVVNAAGRQATASADVRIVDTSAIAPADEGRIFLETADTVGIWEFNNLDVDFMEPLPNGTIVTDLSGNGLDAVVEGNDSGELIAIEGDLVVGENSACERTAGGVARIAVNDDDNAFEMEADQDFAIELYVTRAEQVGGQNWGILAGTWHSRTLLDDNGDPNADGAWYGYGFIRHNDGGPWRWMCSPVSPDGTVAPGSNEISGAAFDIPPGSHYVVASVDRAADRVSVYVDGDLKGAVNVPDGQAFITPTDYEPARFIFLNGEDDGSRGAYRVPPTGYGIDAARVLYRTIEAEEVLENYLYITAGIAVPPAIGEGGASLRPGDVNGDGGFNISDPVAQLNFLFASGELPDCYVVPGSEPVALTEAGLAILDFNGDGSGNIADAVGSLGFQFGGGAPPALGEGCARIAGSCASNCTQ